MAHHEWKHVLVVQNINLQRAALWLKKKKNQECLTGWWISSLFLSTVCNLYIFWTMFYKQFLNLYINKNGLVYVRRDLHAHIYSLASSDKQTSVFLIRSSHFIFLFHMVNMASQSRFLFSLVSFLFWVVHWLSDSIIAFSWNIWIVMINLLFVVCNSFSVF